jgi:3-oxoacyl-[acyl-carrier protein] reductase
MRELEGRTALVTGGSRGIGRKIVDRLVDAGALVAFNFASNEAAAAQAVREVEARGGEAFAIQAELGRDGSIATLTEALTAGLQSRRGDSGLDILVNNVGGGRPARISETSADFLDETFAVNLRAPFLLTRALIPQLRDGGRVVNISSATVRVGFEEAAAYVCCKAGLDTFSHLLAKELGGRGITVNSVAVGRTAGETNAAYFSDPENVRQIADVTALKRVGSEEDVAGVVYALISPDGGWITGQVVDATGGYRI